MNAEQAPLLPNDSVSQAEQIVHQAWRHGESAALEAQAIVDNAHRTDPQVATLKEMESVVEAAPEVGNFSEADTPDALDQAEETVRRAEFLDKLMAVPRYVEPRLAGDRLTQLLEAGAHDSQAGEPTEPASEAAEAARVREALLQHRYGAEDSPDFLR
jgi:hypothetical protein